MAVVTEIIRRHTRGVSSKYVKYWTRVECNRTRIECNVPTGTADYTGRSTRRVEDTQSSEWLLTVTAGPGELGSSVKFGPRIKSSFPWRRPRSRSRWMQPQQPPP